MDLASRLKPFVSTSLLDWKSIGKLQQTVVGCIEKTGVALHSGKVSTVRIWPELAGKGRYFEFGSVAIPATIEFANQWPLCTSLRRYGASIRTVEHLLSALEGMGVDNCRIEVINSDASDIDAEVPIIDGSARHWVEAIEQVGLIVALDCNGKSCEKLAPFLKEPVHVSKDDSHITAFPSPKVDISYGINFPQVPAISCQWFSSFSLDHSFYAKQIAPSRTFCVYEEVEKLRRGGFIQGGSAENALVFSTNNGLMNPPLRSPEEPCRHKLLDLIGDFSFLARNGSQGLPVANIIAYKGGHSLHLDFVRQLSRIG